MGCKYNNFYPYKQTITSYFIFPIAFSLTAYYKYNPIIIFFIYANIIIFHICKLFTFGWITSKKTQKNKPTSPTSKPNNTNAAERI